MPDLTGQTLLRRYRVAAFLGRGGMAEVYRAWDEQRAASVALKVLNEDLAADYVFLRRFAREAQVLARLDHPHVVRFFGFEQTPEQAFLIMDYIEGVTLRRELRRLERPMTLEETLAVLQPVCGALDYAHALGVIHCDVKPDNIFLQHGGRVVLGDFGIARLSESATMTLSTFGTPAYMAPEQCLSRPFDSRIDVYSLGIMAYEMLTLDRPFKGETQSAASSHSDRIRWEHIYRPPPPLRWANPTVTPQVEAAVLRALEKQPDHRWPTAYAFWEALAAGRSVRYAALSPYEPVRVDPLISGGPGGVEGAAADRPGRAGWRRLSGWAAVALAVGIVLAVSLFFGLALRLMNTTGFHPVETAPVRLAVTEAPPPTVPVKRIAPTQQPSPTPVASTTSEAIPGAMYVAYIVDASSGMASPWDPNVGSRLRAAQLALADHWQALGPGANIGLRAYGHRLDALDAGTCGDVETLVPVAANQVESLLAALATLQAQGLDSLAETLRLALGDFEFLPERRNAVVLLSDGGDTCGGNPAQVIVLQRQTGITLPMYVLGLGVGAESRAALAQLAVSSGGQYFDVADSEELQQTLALIVQLLLEQ